MEGELGEEKERRDIGDDLIQTIARAEKKTVGGSVKETSQVLGVGRKGNPMKVRKRRNFLERARAGQ